MHNIEIEEIKTPKHVYDIEVEEDHRFFANNVLVHNTDSVFVNTNLDKTKANSLGFKIVKDINNFYKNHIKKNYNRTSFLELEFKKQIKKKNMN